jgi:hypothetical protein
MMRSHQDIPERRMQGKLARPVWGWGPGENPRPTPLFKGSVAAGELAANLLTIIGSAIRNDLDVRAYLDHVLRRLLKGETDAPSLTPLAWPLEQPEAIRL